MAIHFITGKPGGGKTFYALKLIVEELLLGSRMIITNVPISLPALAVYLQDKMPNWKYETWYPTANGDIPRPLIDRVWVLNDEECATFWTYRPEGVRIEKLTKEQWQRGQLPSYASVRDKGVMYVIDEIHNYFGARQWAETGRDVLFYLSQHRKLGDTVICITQAVQNVEKQFRSVAQDFTYLRNFSKETWGKFRMPGIFRRATFPCPAKDTDRPMETGTFRLDVAGLASCYDTGAGVGIHGRSDVGEKTKGLHWSVAVIGIVAVVVALFGFMPNLLARLVGGSGVPLAKNIQTTAVHVAQGAGLGPVGGPQPVRQYVAPPPIPLAITNIGPRVYVTGRAKLGNHWLIMLSDGRNVEEGDGHLTGMGPAGLVVDGKVATWTKQE